MVMIEEGNVLWMRIRFNNDPGDISMVKHPYLVLQVYDEAIELGQMDSLEGKGYKLAYRSNKPIRASGETVISKNSYIQMDNTILIEKYEELERFKRTENKLTVFDKIQKEYYKYHDENEIDENKIVFMSKDEIECLND